MPTIHACLPRDMILALESSCAQPLAGVAPVVHRSIHTPCPMPWRQHVAAPSQQLRSTPSTRDVTRHLYAFTNSATRSGSSSGSGSTQELPQTLGPHACGFSSIPVLDLSRFLSGSEKERQTFLSDLQYAAHAVGFFYVEGHGLPPDFDVRALAAARRLFAMSAEAKAAVDYAGSASFRGYMVQGVENTAGKVDQREQFEYGLEFADLPADATAVQPPYRRLHGPNQWPDEVTCPGIKQELQEYLASMRGVAETLLQALALAAGLTQEAFIQDHTQLPYNAPAQLSLHAQVSQQQALQGMEAGSSISRPVSLAHEHAQSAVIGTSISRASTSSSSNDDGDSSIVSSGTGGTQPEEPPYMTVKVVRYPPTAGGLTDSTDGGGGGDAAGGARAGYGVGPHSDSGLITLLVQDEVGGLEALSGLGASAHWVAVPPRPGAIVVNLGELLQAATQGYYVATVHRVINANASRERLSLPFFYNAKLDQRMQPCTLPAGLAWLRAPPETESMTHGGTNRLLVVAGENVLKSFVRSHPQIARKHHPDLFA